MTLQQDNKARRQRKELPACWSPTSRGGLPESSPARSACLSCMKSQMALATFAVASCVDPGRWVVLLLNCPRVGDTGLLIIGRWELPNAFMGEQ